MRYALGSIGGDSACQFAHLEIPRIIRHCLAADANRPGSVGLARRPIKPVLRLAADCIRWIMRQVISPKHLQGHLQQTVRTPDLPNGVVPIRLPQHLDIRIRLRRVTEQIGMRQSGVGSLAVPPKNSLRSRSTALQKIQPENSSQIYPVEMLGSYPKISTRDRVAIVMIQALPRSPN